MGLFNRADREKIDLTKKLSASELKAVSYAVYYTASKAGDSEGKQLSDLLVSGKRRWVFPIEYDYLVSAVDAMIQIMETKKKTTGLTPDLPQVLLDDLNSARRKL